MQEKKNYTAPEMEVIALSEIESFGGSITNSQNDSNGSE